MLKNKLILASTSAAALLALAHCGGSSPGPSNGTGGTTNTGGTTSTGGTTGTTGGTTGTTGGTTGTTGGTTGTTGGTTGTTGGTTGTTGGTTGTGGAKGGTTGSTGGAAGGAPGSTGGAANTGVDQGGVPLAKVGDSTDVSKKYLNLGEMRLINNRWGSDARNCTGTMQKVVVNSDMTFGWEFNRPACGGDKGFPDYPEVEFGVAPFGTTSSLLTTPAFSSTTLLPIQIKDLTSATLNIDSFNTTFQSDKYWDTGFELWISKKNPLTNEDAGVFAEIIVFTGWNNGRNDSGGGWVCGSSGNVTAGQYSYKLCHHRNGWSSNANKWRFINLLVNGNSMPSFTGKVDIKALIDWVMKSAPAPESDSGNNPSGSVTSDMWLTRIEVGAEIDDNTRGTTKIRNLTFEINGQSRSAQFGK